MNFKQLVYNKKYKTDKFSDHNYLDTYAALFDPIKYSVNNILEVGVQRGHSLLLWRDFFVNANVIGVDISDEDLIVDLSLEDRISFYKDNAYTKYFINKISNIKFDIIIDDGNHIINNMSWFVKHYYKLLTDDGILIVEDLEGARYFDILQDFLPKRFQSNANMVDLRKISNIKNDILFLLNKDKLCI